MFTPADIQQIVEQLPTIRGSERFRRWLSAMTRSDSERSALEFYLREIWRQPGQARNRAARWLKTLQNLVAEHRRQRPREEKPEGAAVLGTRSP